MNRVPRIGPLVILPFGSGEVRGRGHATSSAVGGTCPSLSLLLAHLRIWGLVSPSVLPVLRVPLDFAGRSQFV